MGLTRALRRVEVCQGTSTVEGMSTVEDVEDVEAVKAVEAVEGEHVEILCC